MTILANDIKIRASKLMADVANGGGGPSANVIEWGQSNTMFDDIDTVSRTLGNVSIRQAFLHVDTPNTDKLLGAYAMVAKLPADDNVTVTLAACDPFATRSQIADAIANYLIKGVPWNGWLLGNHVAGQANIQIFQRVGTALPTVGRTLVLVVNEGLSTEKVEWVRVIKVESETRVFTDNQGDYSGMVVSCEISAGLTQAMAGTDPNRYFTVGAGKAIVRDTTAADAANYYGAAALSVAGALGDSSVKTTGVYGQLVPSSATPVPALDQRPAARRTLTLATSPRQVQVAATPHTRRIKISQENRGLSYVAQLTPLPEPGTVVIKWVGLGNRQTVADDGAGSLTGAGAGTLNATTGSLALTLPSLPDVGSAVVISWGERTAYTNRSAQGASMRSPEFVWVLEGDGTLVPASLTIGYTSAGTVRSCTVNAAGVIAGDGTGRVDWPSKTVQFRPTYMPDAGAQFACDYELSSTVTEVLAAPTVDAGGYATLSLAQQPAAGTLAISWVTSQEVSGTSGGSITAANAAKNATSSTGVTNVPKLASDSALTSVSGSSGVQAYFGPAGTAFTSGSGIAYEPQLVTTTRGASTSSTYTTRSAQETSTRILVLHTATDDGAGNFDAGSLGTVAYASKTVSLKMVDPGHSTGSYGSDYENAAEFSTATGSGGGSSGGSTQKGGSYGTTGVAEQLVAGSSVVATYMVGTASPTAASMTYTPPEVVIDLCRFTTDRIVPGSIQFNWMGTVYTDIEGVLYYGATVSSPGTACGTVDYAAGLARMTDYVVSGSPTNLTLLSLWTQKGNWHTASAFFMTDASPVQPGQITITVLDVAGTQITVDCDLNGNLTGDHAIGKFEFQNGLGELQFGDFVLDSSLTAADKAEWWYNPADVGAVQAGKIWRPWPVDPSTLRYNAVSNLYLPIDPDILGLNPVRLPQDGRVPIYKKGRMICIGHHATVAAATYANGNTIDLGRPRVSHVWLIDANGALITSGYTATEADLDAGHVQVTDISGWAQPITVEHRIQDMRLCTDVQIDGTVSFNFPLSHDFPVGSVCSSVLLFGTLFARVAGLFDQQTWDGVTWADSVTGNPATATYNDAANPIIVSNAGALTERYAIRFKSDATSFELIGQYSGFIAEGSKNADFAPPNPFNPAVPLMQVAAAGWGSGWINGNVLFPKEQAAMAPFIAVRCVQPSLAAGTDYSFDLLAGGDVDRPPSAP